jgi:hypothetical protein
MLQVFYLDVAYVAMAMPQMYAPNVPFFRHMLQLFHLSITKVDMDVGLLSEEEKANAGAMATSI